MKVLLAALVLITLTVNGSCQSHTQERVSEFRASKTTHEIYIVKRNWHSGIILPAKLMQTYTGWTFTELVKPCDFYELGWGDRRYYTQADPHWSTGMRALFWPTSATLHVRGLRREQVDQIPRSKRFQVQTTQLDALLQHIEDAFAKDPQNHHPIPMRAGLYENSFFYEAHGTFFAFNTCNTWVASLAHTAGLGIHPSLAFTSWLLMTQLRSSLKRSSTSQ